MGREEIFIDLGGGAPKTPILCAKLAEIRIFTVFAPCDAHAGWLADLRPLARHRVAGGVAPWGSMGSTCTRQTILPYGATPPHTTPCASLRVRGPQAIQHGRRKGRKVKFRNFSEFCVKSRCFWRAAPQVNEDFLAPHRAQPFPRPRSGKK